MKRKLSCFISDIISIVFSQSSNSKYLAGKKGCELRNQQLFPKLFLCMLLVTLLFSTTCQNISPTDPMKNQALVYHDFQDGKVSSWGGNALMENIEGTLKLTSIDTISWRWEIFDRRVPGPFTKGSFEFDTKLLDQGYFFNIVGHAKSSLSLQSWGPMVEFQQGKVFNHDSSGFVDTGFGYLVGHWYHIRIIFNNSLGKAGRFLLYIRNISHNEPEQFIGELDYWATQGPLQDVVQFGFAIRILDKVSKSSMYIDNVKLVVE